MSERDLCVALLPFPSSGCCLVSQRSDVRDKINCVCGLESSSVAFGRQLGRLLFVRLVCIAVRHGSYIKIRFY